MSRQLQQTSCTWNGRRNGFRHDRLNAGQPAARGATLGSTAHVGEVVQPNLAASKSRFPIRPSVPTDTAERQRTLGKRVFQRGSVLRSRHEWQAYRMLHATMLP